MDDAASISNRSSTSLFKAWWTRFRKEGVPLETMTTKLVFRPIVEVVSELEIRAFLRDAFAGVREDAKALNDLAFWRTELVLAGRAELYDEEHRRYERVRRNIPV